MKRQAKIEMWMVIVGMVVFSLGLITGIAQAIGGGAGIILGTTIYANLRKAWE